MLCFRTKIGLAIAAGAAASIGYLWILASKDDPSLTQASAGPERVGQMQSFALTPSLRPPITVAWNDANGLEVSMAAFKGKVVMLNFWASWCPPCRVEHPQLEELSELENVELYGVNYKDKKNSALNFLKEYGNPFLKIGTDQSGRNAIEWGVYGVPETFLIDQEGRVLLRHAGPITKEIMNTIFYKFVNK